MLPLQFPNTLGLSSKAAISRPGDCCTVGGYLAPLPLITWPGNEAEGYLVLFPDSAWPGNKDEGYLVLFPDSAWPGNEAEGDSPLFVLDIMSFLSFRSLTLV